MNRAALALVETLADAALLVVATCFVFIPEARVAAMTHVLYALAMAGAAIFIWRLYVSGMLGLTPKQIFHSTRRPRVTLLSTAATLMGVVAVVISTMR